MHELPTDNTVFSVTVTDRFGCIEENNKDYTAIETKALFSWEAFDYKTEVSIKTGNQLESISEQAPLIVQFTNESKNGYEYTWYFGDSTRTDDRDSIFTLDYMIQPLHTYYYTNKTDDGKTYKMKFLSKSEAGCLDSVFLDINVKPVKIEFPNVFTPNDDPFNNVFIVKEGFESIRNFKITIFNRVGQIVHEYDGDIRDWEGWDGTVKNSGVRAAEGNYFFVVDIKGWDKKSYNNNNISKLTDSDSGTDATPPTGDGSADAKVEFGLIRLYR